MRLQSPWLAVPDGMAAVQFYVAAFGATVLEALKDDTSNIAFAHLSFGEARFWIQMDMATSPSVLGGVPVRLIVAVPDPDQLFGRAVVAGATPVALMHEEHGWRTERVSDPFGHQWEFAKSLAEPDTDLPI